MVTICTASLTFNNSTFCPHSVIMCFVWIWEQTAIISLYSINWLVFITETECVYCEVGAGSLYIMNVNFHLAYRVRSEATPFQICGAHSGTGTVVQLPCRCCTLTAIHMLLKPITIDTKYFHFFLVSKMLNRSWWRRQYCTFSNLSYKCALCVPCVHWWCMPLAVTHKGLQHPPMRGGDSTCGLVDIALTLQELHKIASGPEWPRVPCCYDVIWFHLNSLCGSCSLRNMKGG